MTGSEPPFAPLPAGRAWFAPPGAEAADRAGRGAVPGIVVTGADRTAFLTRIMSGDLPKPPGAARTALLGPKGNLVAAAVATTLSDRVCLETEPARLAALRDGLDRYRIADAVEIADDQAGPRIRVFGERAAEVIAVSTPVRGFAVADLAPGGTIETDVGFVRRDFRPWPSFTIRTRTDNADAVLSALKGPHPVSMTVSVPGVERSGGVHTHCFSPTEESPAVAAYLRLAAGEPAWCTELSATSLPLATGLATHVRLGKGCYIGQEYVARQAHRGRVLRLLRQLRFTGARADPPPPGTPVVYDEDSLAEITSSAPRPSCWEDDGPALALAILPEAIPPGAAVRCGTAEATVHSLP